MLLGISLLILVSMGALWALLGRSQSSSNTANVSTNQDTIERSNSSAESQTSLLANEASKLDLPNEPELIEVQPLQEEMIAQAKALEQSHSNSTAALDLAASVYYDLNQPNEADRLWKACFKLEPKEADLYVNYSRFLNQLDRSEEAIELLNKVHAKSIETNVSYYQLALAYNLTGETEKALDVCNEVIRRFPDYGECCLLIGKLQNKLGRFEDARKNLEKALDLHQPELEVWPALIPVLVRLGERQQATDLQKEMKSALESEKAKATEAAQPFHVRISESLRGRAARLFRNSSLIEKKSNNHTQAKALLDRSLRLDPKHPRSLLMLAEQFVQTNQIDSAIAVFQRLTELQPENIVNFSNLAALAFRAGKHQLAAKALESGLKTHTEETTLQISLAKVYMSLGKPFQARELANKVLGKQENGEALMVLAASYQFTGEHDKAARIMDRARSLTAPPIPK
jgi:tetratricopeptide (TPR) repeat protein